MADTDWTDRHVARWRDHWVDVPFDDDVEGVVVRIGRLQRYLKGTMQRAVTEVGLQDFEYETLHSLMIRDTPGTASPTDLAEELGVSGAGMTGRLDKLEQAGWVQRRPRPTTGAGSSWRSPGPARTSGDGPWPSAARRRRRWWASSPPRSAPRSTGC